MEKKYVLFLDNISRTILATLVDESPTRWTVVNPVVLQVVADQQNKIKVQLVPLLLRDLQKDGTENVQWSYNRETITPAELSGLNERFLAQYEFVTGLTPEKAAQLSAERAKAATPSTPVKLFDDKGGEVTNG